MRFSRLVIAVLVVLSVGQAGALAWSGCPAGYVDEIFCDDFDTYCTTGGEPGSPDCAIGAGKHDPYLRRVWHPTSTGGGGGLCGSQYTVEDSQQDVGYYPPAFNQSPPFGGRYPCQGDGVLGQQTFRDWVLSPLPTDAPGQVLDLHRLIGDVFNKPGYIYDAVAGTDDKPLVMEFFMGGQTAGKIYFGSGYKELALGDDRANTDYVNAPDCATYCNPPINQGPFPIICAQGNPTGPMPGGCPPVSSAPVHASIAVGVLALVDPDPCHCGVVAHGGQNAHLVVYDGKQWLNLRLNNPVLSAGEAVAYKGSTPMPPPYEDLVPGSGVPRPGSFVLAQGINYSLPRAYNWVTLTVKATTFSVELNTLIRANNITYPAPYPAYDSGAYQYWIRHVMNDIPRQYLGPFNTIRGGVGSGCPLESSQSWTACVPGEARKCLDSNSAQAGAIAFNDFVLHGGSGYSQLGACCLPYGTCIDPMSAGDCASRGGAFRGPSTVCGDGSICLGACCKGEANGCADTRKIDCPQPFVFKGEGTRCASTACPCSDPFADADLDGDVDQLDFAVFQACFSGSGSQSLNAICKCFDRDNSGAGDQDVDMDDLAKFEACASGPGIPLNANCDQ